MSMSMASHRPRHGVQSVNGWCGKIGLAGGGVGRESSVHVGMDVCDAGDYSESVCRLP